MLFVEAPAEVDLLRVHVVVSKLLAKTDQLLVRLNCVQAVQAVLFLVHKVFEVLLYLQDVELDPLYQAGSADVVELAPDVRHEGNVGEDV